MAAQTTTIETVTVVRPLKVIALICLILSLLLLVVCLATTYWLRTQHFHTGLFEECVSDDIGANVNPIPQAPPPGQCKPIQRDNLVYIKIVLVLLIVAAVATALAIGANVFGLRFNDLHKKHVFYKGATYLSLFSVLCELTSLIVFPVCFFLTMHSYGVRNWDFDWSYGVAWGAMLFTFGASLLLICDKEHDEVYYKEKTIYNPPDNFA